MRLKLIIVICTYLVRYLPNRHLHRQAGLQRFIQTGRRGYAGKKEQIRDTICVLRSNPTMVQFPTRTLSGASKNAGNTGMAVK